MDRWNCWIKVLVAVTAVVFLVVAAGCAKKPKPAPEVAAEPQAQTDTTQGGTGGETGDQTGEPVQPIAAEIEDVFFDYDRHHLRDNARRILEANAQLLLSDPMVSLILEGHCDERGTVEYNLALGERRAQSVKSYLEQLGVDASRLRTISYGEERPFALAHDEPAWAQNRRVHFVKQ